MYASMPRATPIAATVQIVAAVVTPLTLYRARPPPAGVLRHRRRSPASSAHVAGLHLPPARWSGRVLLRIAAFSSVRAVYTVGQRSAVRGRRSTSRRVAAQWPVVRS